MPAKAKAPPAWSFEADYYTACNCDWGCPCNFNARPSQGFCAGFSAYSIVRGAFGPVKLDGGRFAIYYHFPGLVEQGNGVACAYVDPGASGEQRKALEAIATGNAGGGIFELFAKKLTREFLPTKMARITFDVRDGKGRVEVEGIGGSETELLGYPDGTVLHPVLELPHGIEYKKALMTNAKRLWWSDPPLLMAQDQRYGAVGRVKYDQTGCVG